MPRPMLRDDIFPQRACFRCFGEFHLDVLTLTVRGQVCTCRMVSLCVEIRRVVEWAKLRISLSFSRITRVGEVYCVRRTTGTLVKLSNGAAVSAGAIAKCEVSERSLTAFRVLVVLHARAMTKTRSTTEEFQRCTRRAVSPRRRKPLALLATPGGSVDDASDGAAMVIIFVCGW